MFSVGGFSDWTIGEENRLFSRMRVFYWWDLLKKWWITIVISFLSHVSMVLGIEQSLATNVFEVLGFNPQLKKITCVIVMHMTYLITLKWLYMIILSKSCALHMIGTDNSLILHIYIIIRKYYHTYFELIHEIYSWFWNNAK